MEILNCSKLLLPFLTAIYVIGELGHFLIGVVSKAAAQELQYGDKSCIPQPQLDIKPLGFSCNELQNETSCLSARSSGENQSFVYFALPTCDWNFNGLGAEYQILAGPSFMACFTIAGVIWGVIADKFNRVYLLAVATLFFSVCLSATAFAEKYWHLVLLRMGLAIGVAACAPLSAGLIADVFHQNRRAQAMGIFKWGIYFGYGASFAVGTYLPDIPLFSEGSGWRAPFFVSGIPGIFLALLLVLTIREPRKDEISEEAKQETPESPESLKDLLKKPVIYFLLLAACIRHSAGFCWGYNSALYYQLYYPNYANAFWYLTFIPIIGGPLGVLIGGFISDKFVKLYGISARAGVLAASQLASLPFTLAMLYVDPPYSFLTLFVGYILSEMWFGGMYALLVEFVPEKYKSTGVGVGLFVINNVGGNLPLVVDPLRKISDFRTAIAVVDPGGLFISSSLFFICWVMMRGQR